MNEHQIVLSTNMVLEKLRKHLTHYNFLEQITLTQQDLASNKIFTLDAMPAQRSMSSSIAILQSKTIHDDVWLIKILDVFFNEILLLDMYHLKINFLGCRDDQEQHSKKIAKDQKIAHYQDVLCSSCQQEWQTVINTLRILSVSFSIDQSFHAPINNAIKTQFEFTARSTGKLNSLAHGGQIELKTSHKGNTQAQVCIDTIINLDHKLAMPTPPVLHVIVPSTQAQSSLALLLANMLHQNGKCVDIMFTTATPKDTVAYAQQTCSKYLLLLGDDEQKSGTVTIKNLTTGRQETVRQAHIIEHLQ